MSRSTTSRNLPLIVGLIPNNGFNIALHHKVEDAGTLINARRQQGKGATVNLSSRRTIGVGYVPVIVIIVVVCTIPIVAVIPGIGAATDFQGLLQAER